MHKTLLILFRARRVVLINETENLLYGLSSNPFLEIVTYKSLIRTIAQKSANLQSATVNWKAIDLSDLPNKSSDIMSSLITQTQSTIILKNHQTYTKTLHNLLIQQDELIRKKLVTIAIIVSDQVESFKVIIHRVKSLLKQLILILESELCQLQISQ